MNNIDNATNIVYLKAVRCKMIYTRCFIISLYALQLHKQVSWLTYVLFLVGAPTLKLLCHPTISNYQHRTQNITCILPNARPHYPSPDKWRPPNTLWIYSTTMKQPSSRGSCVVFLFPSTGRDGGASCPEVCQKTLKREAYTSSPALANIYQLVYKIYV